MSLVAQQLIFGLLLGGFYVIVAIGFSLVWGVLNIVNLSHGALVMMGAYLTYALFIHLGIDPFLSLPLVAAALFGFGYILQRGVINRVIGAPLFFTLLLTFGVNLIIVNLLLTIFTADVVAVSPHYWPWQSGGATGITIARMQIPYLKLGTLVVGLGIAGLIAFLLSRTRLGLAIQAVGSDRGAAQLVGIDLRHVYAMTFAIGAAAAGVAGGLLSTLTAFTPDSGTPLTLQAFVVCVLGGLGSARATVVGGLTFGLAETFGQIRVPIGHSTYGLGAGYANAIAFGIMVLILIVRPQGILGRRRP